MGTNLGDKKENLTRVIDEINKIAEVLVCSSVYETKPIGIANQSLFYNQVIEVQTVLNPEKLLIALKHIEQKMGRVSTIRNGPRIIDCDILYYGNVIISTDVLTIPHPHAAERAFVLIPLSDIAPAFVDPVKKRQIRELVQKLSREEKDKVKQLDKHG